MADKGPEAGAQESVTSLVDGSKAFRPGHVFTAEELPEGKEYLAGALYFGDNTDGTMHIVSANLFASMNTLFEYKRAIEKVNKNGGNVRVGTGDDWKSLLSREFDHAAIGMDVAHRYGCWMESGDDTYGEAIYPEDGWSSRKNSTSLAGGFFFSDEPRFEPV